MWKVYPLSGLAMPVWGSFLTLCLTCFCAAEVLAYRVSEGELKVSLQPVRPQKDSLRNAKGRSKAVSDNRRASRPRLSAAECRKLRKGLSQMQQAQKSLLNTMVRKNEMLAQKLSSQADQMVDVADDDQRGQGHSSEVKNRIVALDLKRAARLMRQQRAKEQQIVEKFNRASSSLLLRVQSCL